MVIGVGHESGAPGTEEDMTDQATSAAGDDRTGPLRVVVVGGVAGGMSAATRMRRLDEEAEITVVERSGPVGKAVLYVKGQGGAVSRKVLFDSAPPVLAEMAPAPTFAL